MLRYQCIRDEKYEKKYLVQLLGADLYALFIADLTAPDPQVPQSVRFLNIFNPFSIDQHSCLYYSEGIREMLVQFIYFHYVRENQVINTAGGTVSNSVELGLNASFMGNIVQVYNQGVKNAHCMQWYIHENELEYPEENKQPFEYTSGI